ncbi:hypothetical protein ONE63_011444 [Megalurothrips usitatus]|uniref:Uncharacterized protein n=1 Tax=Megalurothrips usitatus TaxID=439358 RepID=A0AAV7X396_9NEOP|nr:hypothetical protein ONE63_011444 [Megalurothrips usitatus]
MEDNGGDPTDSIKTLSTPSFHLHDCWRKLEMSLNSTIDIHIKGLLQINGFGNFTALKELDDTDITSIEEMVRKGRLEEKVEKDLIPMFLGSVRDASKFSFELGEKKQIRAIVNHLKTNHVASKVSLTLSSHKETHIIPDMFRPKSKVVKPRREVQFREVVPSGDLHDEKKQIVAQLKEYCKKKGIAKAIVSSIDLLDISIEVAESQTQASNLSQSSILQFTESDRGKNTEPGEPATKVRRTVETNSDEEDTPAIVHIEEESSNSVGELRNTEPDSFSFEANDSDSEENFHLQLKD